MKDGYFIFDNVVHMYDNRPSNVTNDLGKRNIEAFHRTFGGKGHSLYRVEEKLSLDVDEALRYLFVHSNTDMAMAQTVPLFGLWEDGFAPARQQWALKEACPERVVFCGGVDPIYQGIRGAVREMQRQVEEWGAVSFKFYKAHGPRLAWRVDDRDVAYPLWEKARELGITHVQFHCGLPFGLERVEDLRPNDIQAAAADFPELVFVIHHLGLPYFDETVNIASRFENVWLSLSSIVFNTWAVSPWETYTRLGTVLRSVGHKRVLWGSEAFIWPDVQPLIDLFADMKMPEELQERYGFPEITDEARRNIFGLNQARLLGVDVEQKLRELAPKLSDAERVRAAGKVA
ncbi:MAG: amidohydrolase [Betaproteobacteria bacterium RIFCSPLOWO2_12_FULL_65_14]|nr:MAG: amidohydrolase [Betaproteobacteria bacterium RIFCSPLOWO2_12_FULL_65_14]